MPIGKDAKHFWDLLRQAVAEETSAGKNAVLKLLPVTPTARRYYQANESAVGARRANDEVLKGLFVEDPSDPDSLCILVDATFLGGGGGGTTHPAAVVTFNNAAASWNNITQSGNIPIVSVTDDGNGNISIDPGDGSGPVTFTEHPPMTVTNNAGAFAWNAATQTLNVPPATTIVDNGNDTYTVTNSDGTTFTIDASGSGGGATHPAANITNNAAPFSFNVATQAANIPLPSFTEDANNYILDEGDGTPVLNIPKSSGKVNYAFSGANISGHIWATGTGITVTEVGGGVIRFNIPAGVDPCKIVLSFPASYTNSNAIYPQFAYADTRTFNTSAVNVNAPIIRLENLSAVGAGRTSPDFSDGANTSKAGKYGVSAFGNIGAGGTTDLEMSVNDAAQGSNTLMLIDFS